MVTYIPHLIETMMKMNPSNFENETGLDYIKLCKEAGVSKKEADKFPGIHIKVLGLAAINTGGQMLTKKMAEKYKELTGADVFSIYGLNETNGPGFAGDCFSHRMHFNANKYVVEILDENGNPVRDGEEGEIVLTSLSSERASPIVRLMTGDIGRVDYTNCNCGSYHPSISVLGRKGGDVKFSGEFLRESELVNTVQVVDGVGIEYQFRIRQTDLGDDLMVVLVERDQTYKRGNETLKKNVTSALDNYIRGGKLKVKILEPGEINKGKLQLNIDFHGN